MKNFIDINIKRPIVKYFHILQSLFFSIKYKNPAKNIKIIAVTGTSGKSTTSTMIYHLLKECGFKVGLISTVEAIAGDKVLDTGLHVTTPDAKDLQKILKLMKEESMEYVVLETSSHAIAQGRLGFLKLDFAVFTNIKHDHLDWHKTWNNYALAKATLINKLKSNGKVIVNFDDADSYTFIKNRYYSYAKNALNFIEYSAKKEVSSVKDTIDGVSFNYKDLEFLIPIIGQYNIENSLASIKVAESLNIKITDIKNAFKKFKTLKGRMEIMQKTPFTVIVDFAHNADSLERSLQAIKKIDSVKRIITVFGSAGLRDVQKRYDMGKVAAKYSDIIIATSEDPRIESLEAINSLIIEGAQSESFNLIKRFKSSSEFKSYLNSNPKISKNSIFAFDQETVDSRFDAIEFAIKIAQDGDVVITQGKGHEQSLCFGTTEYPFTDQEAVIRALKA